MTIEKEDKEKQELQRVMSLLELTLKNQTLAEQYLDLSQPEDASLLKEVEHQNFQKLTNKAKRELHEFLEVYKERNAKRTERYIRLDDWFHRHIKSLEKFLEIPDDMYIRWALSYKEAKILERMAVKAPEAICEVSKDVSVDETGFLITCVEVGNPQLYKKVKDSFGDSYRRAAAKQAVSQYTTAQDEALRYLLGELEISDILPYVAEWRNIYFRNDANVPKLGNREIPNASFHGTRNRKDKKDTHNAA